MADFEDVKILISEVGTTAGRLSVRAASLLCSSPLVAYTLARSVSAATRTIADVANRYGSDENVREILAAAEASALVLEEVSQCGMSEADTEAAVDSAEFEGRSLVETATDAVRMTSSLEGTMLAPIGMWID